MTVLLNIAARIEGRFKSNFDKFVNPTKWTFDNEHEALSMETLEHLSKLFKNGQYDEVYQLINWDEVQGRIIEGLNKKAEACESVFKTNNNVSTAMIDQFLLDDEFNLNELAKVAYSKSILKN